MNANKASKGESTLVSRLALIIGICAISTAAILIRKCEAPSIAIAAYRLAIAALILLPVELIKQRAVPSRREVGWALLSGFFLAMHFSLWITSLAYTSVASSVLLVTMNPLFVMVISWLVLGERTPKSTTAAVALGLIGTVTISWGDFTSGTDPLLGDALALGGALAASAYLITGRVARRIMPTNTYVAWCYSASALFLIAAMLLMGHPIKIYPAETMTYMILLALVPQLIGHTVINWSLAHLPAPTVAVAILGEAVGATLLAWAVLGEAPPAMTIIGAAFIIAAIVIVFRENPKKSEPEENQPELNPL
ncbi:MAG: hypothetical protein C0608_02755 [Deltaproteobacteria bacterium]|nr:MAG: hypothetical protein C0608_02755 [Deltaproteobacteria bacterium]